ncbi:MAG: hypothetical protein UU81_C0004G0008 [Microgenomates group bacterium GW2011_GWC1_41_8]|uniref:Orotate phosphoribosyltransferase n=3 Tax=Candidatus Roizmaniibacteriota TaxID=1752723 RepID=A0A0G1ABS1_9BACT|nr:MAG: hypothetical protein UT85_C0011G0007 [Candidatus Levybacteria bacterium GW2011_GWA2_40_16]KKR71841.1 MAG: hypothetical protein UU14_C0017G0006 [Candidatus Roizmanbacteria bacterium GW2011_GWB1_40_7]KKR92660.1 MAG: hypothetical protein UU41_C0026G0013 [Candidatus Roizmanbacteria bacterium GW2011_GWA1_41_13]KKS22688.1 MAG: hypothetical protein UU78_C0013G0014 [Candidatus Roizmanbacteria bacterium GW2011_GWC2_41_7]KKS24611.1 MAG: hypothetical protein UU81_C0004G0008 [Microgenomates group b
MTASQNDQNTWAMFVHLSTLLGLIIPFGNIALPLIIWQVKKNEMPDIESHGKQATNFQISMTIYAAISALLMIIVIGFFLFPALVILDVIFTVKAALAARDGKQYQYPLTIQFIK